ncbi:hypothetical protein [Niveibacterium sp.]|uniref:hypothetical protein n=1 Tax=Niveibacterium sp. TaxID=2017444 RepID=UPI0035AE9A76
MYIAAIAWIYVALMAAVGAQSVVGGVMTFLGFTLPLALVLWLAGTGARRRRRAEREAQEALTPPEDPPQSR